MVQPKPHLPDIEPVSQPASDVRELGVEDVDVVIVGAGLSGIGAACYLQQHCPGKRYMILEARDSIGGTWDLFRYPGIRSDSDMFTLGYGFKPWTGAKAISDGHSIKAYVEEAAEENGITPHIRFGCRVERASWSGREACWTVVSAHGDRRTRVRCNFLMVCSGYYRYDRGHTPELAGRARFRGPIVHPQHWPSDLDYAGKRIVVIGSGATAVSLIPALAERAEHVVMLQRSPTYMLSLPSQSWLARGVRALLPARMAYRVLRTFSSMLQGWIYKRARRNPDAERKRLLRHVRKELGPNCEVDRHFAPDYDPWEQRLCLVPDGDLFRAIRSGKASIVTDRIDTITATGLALASGGSLEADILVTATGLELLLMGGVTFDLDGEPIDLSQTHTYLGMMCSGVPNLSMTFGYINASWTLRADLTAQYVCRVLSHMDKTGTRICTPRWSNEGLPSVDAPWITGFTPGYIKRGIHRFPKQSDHLPWQNLQDYERDRKLLRDREIEDGVLHFEHPAHSLSSAARTGA